MNERLIAAARAVVQRWHSTGRNAAQTAELIKELWDAADALAAQPAAEPVVAVPHVVAPHPELQNALFCYAAGDDGAAAVLIRGWSALIAQIEAEVARGDTPWAELLADLDDWTRDDRGVPYNYSASFEDGYMAIYRISEGAAQPARAGGDALQQAVSDYLEAQDALDNWELQSINREPHDRVMRRRNDARRGLDAALAAAPQPAQACTVESVLHAFESKERGIPQAHIAAQLVTELRAALDAADPTQALQSSWDANQIKQPGWNHVQQAFLDGAREAKANPDASDADFGRAADGYTKRVLEEVDPASEKALRTESWAAPQPAPAEPDPPPGSLTVHESLWAEVLRYADTEIPPNPARMKAWSDAIRKMDKQPAGGAVPAAVERDADMAEYLQRGQQMRDVPAMPPTLRDVVEQAKRTDGIGSSKEGGDRA